MSGCLVCDEVSGAVDVPGGLVSAGSLTASFHVPPRSGDLVYLGYLMVVPRRHVVDFVGLRDDEAAQVGVQITHCSRALTHAGAEHVYVAVVGHGASHLHVHVVPRWPGTPEDIPWHSVDDWSGAPRGTVDEASRFVSALRARTP